jgi:glutathione S-transferase
MAYPYCERPRLTLVTARVSPMVELARWLLERANIPYHEDAHAPVLHVLATRLAGGGNEVPVALTAGGVWDGARDFIHGLDSQLPPAQKVFSADPQERTRDIAFVDEILRRLLKPVRRHVYHALLPYPKLIKPVACDGAPLWERAIVRGLYGPWRRLMARGLDFSPAMLANAPGEIAEAFDLVAGRLNGQPFLGGAKPSGLDIIFSALAAPVIFPPSTVLGCRSSTSCPPTFERLSRSIASIGRVRLCLERTPLRGPRLRFFAPRGVRRPPGFLQRYSDAVSISHAI